MSLPQTLERIIVGHRLRLALQLFLIYFCPQIHLSSHPKLKPEPQTCPSSPSLPSISSALWSLPGDTRQGLRILLPTATSAHSIYLQGDTRSNAHGDVCVCPEGHPWVLLWNAVPTCPP